VIWRAKGWPGFPFHCKRIIGNHLRAGGHAGRCMQPKIVQSCSNLFKNRRFSRENEGAGAKKVETLYKVVQSGGGRWREIR
jgi:hypothetical protein